jgi:histone acetyltransferase (RNA polymerase elongator complex component)
VVQPFIQSGRVAAIRISTRPDYIDEQSLSLLAKYQVKTIELGAQSLDDEVLLMANRGHTVEQVRQASNMIKNAGFELGLQMMVGLPGDTPEKSLQTARQIVVLGAKNTRIYPTLVIKGTELETLYQQGKYKPLTLAEAISLVAGIAEEFEAACVKILRMGLHPSPELTSGGNLAAGPFHVAFGEMVQTERWQKRFNYLLNNEIKKNIPASQNIRIRVAVGQKNAATGFAASNRKLLQQRFIKVIFEECVDLQGFEHAVDID